MICWQKGFYLGLTEAKIITVEEQEPILYRKLDFTNLIDVVRILVFKFLQGPT